ncbi:YtxH domain-containing protein [Rummeliibacillus stabekisii]|uniref:YtxH domain-containing protein n=1 Tax=Rummeliibacillus TaxID=648802 RepID=UPI001681BB12|nr:MULTISPECIES: YtxH domain-containing protein [Rummeliibacillus]MCM3317360.1 YtxH domain-containing protein [Rummeliibacillus stabekisii]
MSNKLVTGLALGAVAGAALSMADRNTRQTTKKVLKRYWVDMQYFANNRDELMNSIQARTGKVKSLYNTFMKDKDFYMKKVEEIQELTPKVKNIVMETKDTFTSNIKDVKQQLPSTNAESNESVIHL